MIMRAGYFKYNINKLMVLLKLMVKNLKCMHGRHTRVG